MAEKYLLLRDGTKKTFTHMEMMGVINITPDSFYAGSRTPTPAAALQRAARMVEEGAEWLDVGGESTRPGAAAVTAEEEQRRVVPVIAALRRRWPDLLLSVDTYRAATAAAAVEAGADLVNDISAMTFDPQMPDVIAQYRVPVVLMHINGRPDHMQDAPHYDDVVREVYRFLEERLNAAERTGIARERTVIDLGIGFGKTAAHNLQLLRRIEDFETLGRPHLLAVSRKSFIGKVLRASDPADRLYGTAAITAYAAGRGIEMARVHDVRANLDAARMAEALR